MGAKDSIKKHKRSKSAEKEEDDFEIVSSKLAQREENLAKGKGTLSASRNRKKKKTSLVDNSSNVDIEKFGSHNIPADETHRISGGIRKSKKWKNSKLKNGKITVLNTLVSNEVESKDAESRQEVDKLQKAKKKKRKSDQSISKVGEFTEKDDASEQTNESEHEDLIANTEVPKNADTTSKTGESKKPRKTKKKNRRVRDELASDNLLESRGQDDHDEVYQMSSGDEDCSKGMKKWITQYYQSRPGIKVLQERIDDFIMAHEAEEEKARLEREAQAAEGGWTVVVHHKGRKKTTDAETGVAVGSVAQAAVVDKVAKKKTKEVGIDFYRFQKREAHRNEIMMLQSKFEQDKKRIQQMRAARKFRPY
ncbi:ribosomal RNA-processing protein-like protein [Striga asiatica]|uniref:Ribosomal RNA-processing protein-like protein n=1 Tax=Striga asiatica TaxID=4170 RepID=A0A5A7NXU2_STRAF|nr:ribosomal RNA-processing protein-like protein [Striga asiatica]